MGSRDGWGIPKEGESQKKGAGMDGGPQWVWNTKTKGPQRGGGRIWGAGMDGGPQRVGDPDRGGAAMDGESVRVGDPKIWGIPKEGSMDGIPKEGESQTMGDLKG